MTTRNAHVGACTITALLSLAFVLSACGGSSSPPPPPPVVGDGNVAGLVTTGAGVPVADAVVIVQPVLGPAILGTTMPDGTYDLVCPNGVHNLTIFKDVEFDDYDAPVLVVANQTTTVDVDLIPAAQYVGSTTCVNCHTALHPQVIAHERSAHPFKVNKIIAGAAPTYPYSMIQDAGNVFDDDAGDVGDPFLGQTDNTLGTPTGFPDVSYVIGGYNWKARYMDLDGFIVTGTNVQFNYVNVADPFPRTAHHMDPALGSLTGYHNNEVDKPFNCGNCHTTGWRHYDAVLNPVRQDGLAGMDGTFAEQGIRCESCHGAGSRHAAAPTALNITRLATARTTDQLTHHSAGYGLPVACGECHTRDGERDYPTYVSGANAAGWAGGGAWPVNVGGRIAASGGMIKHHEQFDEILGLDPDAPTVSTRSLAFAGSHGDCMTCHDPHATTVNQDISGDQPGMYRACTDCHANKVITPAQSVGMAGMDCVECHMPKLAKSATFTYVSPDDGAGPPLGDVTSHIFKINLARDPANQFTADEKFAYPEITGKWACSRCHHAGSGLASFAINFPGVFDTYNPHD